MAEFDLIQRLASGVAPADEGTELGIGDDAAVLVLRPGEVLVAATDTLNEGVHFLPGADPTGLGHKLLAVNLSDLAAMGAEPRWALLNLSLPSSNRGWLDAFAEGLHGLADRHGVTLVGGDTTSGPLSLSLTALGVHAPGLALRRDGARKGDRVMVSGCLGDAALALRRRRTGQEALPPSLAKALDRPEPRIALGIALRGLATACIDLSDGLEADLGHVASGSGLGASLKVDRLPTSEYLEELDDHDRWDLQLAGGDDYELCFTVPEHHVDAVQSLTNSMETKVTEIGVMTDEEGVVALTPEGERYEPSRRPWEHFSEAQTVGGP